MGLGFAAYFYCIKYAANHVVHYLNEQLGKLSIIMVY
jgi:hypothetical protein